MQRGGADPGGDSRPHGWSHPSPATDAPVPERPARAGRASRPGPRGVRRAVILLDTSGLLSAIDASQRQHARCMAAIGTAEGALLLSPFILAELDYLLSVRVGTAAQRMLLDEVARGAY